MPIPTPSGIVKATTAMAAISDARAPVKTPLNRSLPNASVPIGCATDGGTSGAPVRVNGSTLVNRGPKTAIATVASVSTSPTLPDGRRSMVANVDQTTGVAGCRTAIGASSAEADARVEGRKREIRDQVDQHD